MAPSVCGKGNSSSLSTLQRSSLRQFALAQSTSNTFFEWGLQDPVQALCIKILWKFTDCFDWLCHSYSVNTRCNRWPTRVFHGMLDMAITNARILYKYKRTASGFTGKITTKSCVDEIALYLAKPHLQRRLQECSLRVTLREGIKLILQDETTADRDELIDHKLDSKQRCNLCKRSSDKKTMNYCRNCARPIYNDHRAYICTDCAGQ